jgi:hypothetical protein
VNEYVDKVADLNEIIDDGEHPSYDDISVYAEEEYIAPTKVDVYYPAHDVRLDKQTFHSALLIQSFRRLMKSLPK